MRKSIILLILFVLLAGTCIAIDPTYTEPGNYDVKVRDVIAIGDVTVDVVFIKLDNSGEPYVQFGGGARGYNIYERETEKMFKSHVSLKPLISVKVNSIDLGKGTASVTFIDLFEEKESTELEKSVEVEINDPEIENKRFLQKIIDWIKRLFTK